MTFRLADRLNPVRRQRFVGRSAELSLLQSALAAAEPPFQVLYIFGPGGIGKTTLLTELVHHVTAAGLPAAWLDGRVVEPAPEAFVAALRAALGLPGEISPADSLAAHVRLCRPGPPSRGRLRAGGPPLRGLRPRLPRRAAGGVAGAAG